MNKTRHHICLLGVVLLIMISITHLGATHCYAKEVQENKNGSIVLISKKIKPYLMVVEGMRNTFKTDDNIEPHFYYLEDVKQSWTNVFTKLKGEYKRCRFIAIGPEALVFLKANPPDTAVIYSMIFDPSFILPQNNSSCGFFLSISLTEKIEWIQHLFPEMNRFGVLFDPRNNSEYVNNYRQKIEDSSHGESLKRFINIDMLAVSSKAEVPPILKRKWQQIDALILIPDSTIISSTFVKYLIKEALSNNTPVFGYNQFFSDNGALLSFVYDYQKIGEETASFVKENLVFGQDCVSRRSDFNITINLPIADRLNISINRKKISQINESKKATIILKK